MSLAQLASDELEQIGIKIYVVGKPVATTVYISASTNRYPYAADCQNFLVALGSSNYVALWNTGDVHERGIYETLSGHEGAVTCVRFRSDYSIVSGDSKGTLKLWRLKTTQYIEAYTQTAHEAAISTLAVHSDLVVTGSSDSSVKVWHSHAFDGNEVLEEVQSIPFRGRYPLSLAITVLPNSKALILVAGSTDRSIQVFTRSGNNFVPSVTLSGHEDWVKSLDFRHPDTSEDPLVLASGSQDTTIRLWNIQPHKKPHKTTGQDGSNLSDQLLDAFEESLGDLEEADEGGRQISLKRHIITLKDETGNQEQFRITFDALLVGHEAGITSLSWRPTSEGSKQTLLSTSTDSSLILWSPSTILGSSQAGSTSLWINRQRFGDVGGQRLGGFVGGLWNHNGAETLAWGWSGGWRRWRCVTVDKQTNLLENGSEDWTEIGAVGGHNAPVRGLAWSPNGEYIASTSLDQTARIHGAVHKGTSPEQMIWHEIGRPQVHGYNLLRVAFLSLSRFISIADEKVARVFEAPREFLEVVANLGITGAHTDLSERPRAAVVPPLGLSNKAVNDTTTQEGELPQGSLNYTKRRPFEGELASMTLWPEIEKVFGHGYESISLAVSFDRKLAATACKASTPDHAVVRVYDTDTWRPVGEPLAGHALTVTGIEFSPDGRFILTVSRDRTWRLFERMKNGFVPVAADKSHVRIIWDCCWTHEGGKFITASRDKTVKIWNVNDVGSSVKWTPEVSIKLPEAATAVACSPADEKGRRRLAIGLESGEIHVYVDQIQSSEDWKEELIIPSGVAHIHEVHQLAWRPRNNGSKLQLASCSEDGTLKVLVIHTEQSE